MSNTYVKIALGFCSSNISMSKDRIRLLSTLWRISITGIAIETFYAYVISLRIPTGFYQGLANIGLNYGPTFQGLSDIRSSEGLSCCIDCECT